MLITKELKVEVTDKTFLYYKALGYDCRNGDTITVPVEKVHSNCREKIEYECDLCHKPQKAVYKNFVNKHSFDNPMYCASCANLIRVIGLDKAVKYMSTTPKDGYRICKKCLRELPLDIVYFNPDKMCDSGLRHICRECCGDKFKIHDENWCSSWTDEEIALLIKNYANYTGKELQEKFFPNRSVRAIECAGAKYGISKNDVAKAKANEKRSELCRIAFTGRCLTDETKHKLSVKAKERFGNYDAPAKGLKWSNEARQKLSEAKKAVGKWKGESNPRHINPMCGEDNPNWQGGITDLYRELRSETKDWFMATNKIFDWKCALTGVKFDNVHHLVEFKDILAEDLEMNGLDRRSSIGDYTEEEQTRLKEGMRQLHKKYGYGVSLCEPVHLLFHKLYSYHHCNKQDFLEFTNRFVDGEFNNYLQQHGLSINVNQSLYDILQNNLELKE